MEPILQAQASNIKLYIDGVDVSGITDTTGSNPITENIDDTQPYRILYLPSTSHVKISDCARFSKALTQNEGHRAL